MKITVFWSVRKCRRKQILICFPRKSSWTMKVLNLNSRDVADSNYVKTFIYIFVWNNLKIKLKNILQYIGTAQPTLLQQGLNFHSCNGVGEHDYFRNQATFARLVKPLLHSGNLYKYQATSNRLRKPPLDLTYLHLFLK